MKRIIIAGTSSGIGKTTISAGIMGALKRRGKDIVPFKVGPDYIDTGFHHAAAGKESVNLDLWMTGDLNTRFLFENHCRNGDFAVIEGVMGLYDGLGDRDSTGSTAHLAKVIKAPVVLIIDGSHLANSAAAMVLGYKAYDRDVNIAGVIVNHVSSESHYRIIQEAIMRTTEIPCLGFLPKNPEIVVPSRHLGLFQKDEIENLNSLIDAIAHHIEEYIDLDLLEAIAEEDEEPEVKPADPRTALKDICRGLRLGVAKDGAFSFYYADNMELLKYMGFEIIPFSPLNDQSLPEGLDALYFGGGYPECYGERLSSNITFRASLLNALKEGIPTYAECGGYMYLTGGIEDQDGIYHEMTGFLDGYCSMTTTLQRFGYAEICSEAGHHFRGHEFHHSRWIGPSSVKPALQLQKPEVLRRDENWRGGQRKGNVHGAYAHIHFYSNLEAVRDIGLYILKIRRLNNEISTNQKTQ